MTPPHSGRSSFTLEDWKGWEGRWELIEGRPYDMAPPPPASHQVLVASLHLKLAAALEELKAGEGGGPCAEFMAPLDLFLGESVVQPDLMVVCDPSKVTGHGIQGAPDLVVEVLSPATCSKDLVRKRWLYESSGLPEYLVVDPVERFGLLLRLTEGRYQEAARLEWGGEAHLLGRRLSLRIG